MGKYLSASTFYGSLFTEVDVDTYTFTSSNFTASSFTFDLDSEGEPVNIELVRLGSLLETTEAYDNIPGTHKCIGMNLDSGLMVYRYRYNVSQGRCLGTIGTLSDIGFANKYNFVATNGSEATAIGVGAYHSEDTDEIYLFWFFEDDYAGGAKINKQYNIHYDLVYKFVLMNFYGQSFDDGLTISPSFALLSKNESVTFKPRFIKNGNVVSDAEYQWHIGDSSSATGSAYGGFEISSEGVVTLVNPEIYEAYVVCNVVGESYTASAVVHAQELAPGPYDPGGSSGPAGGGGSGIPGGGSSGDPTGGLVPDGSNLPNVASNGLFTMYLASVGDLNTLGAALYVENILANIGKEIMSFLWNSPIEGIISVTTYPFTMSSSSPATSQVNFGALQLPISLTPLDKSTLSINWGSVQIEPMWNNFLDYAPHTSIDLYLPFGTGFVNIDPHDCMGGNLSITTNIDLTKGSCVHNVMGIPGVIGTYNGVCGMQIPVTSIDTAGKTLSLAVSAISAAVSAGSAALGEKAASTGAKSASKIVSSVPGLTPEERRKTESNLRESFMKTAAAPYESVSKKAAGLAATTGLAAFRTPAHVARSGSFTNGAGGLGPSKPFVLITAPEVNIPADYGRLYGYPLNATYPLSSLSGYTEIGAIHLNNISCTMPELEEIEDLLAGGVIL